MAYCEEVHSNSHPVMKPTLCITVSVVFSYFVFCKRYFVFFTFYFVLYFVFCVEKIEFKNSKNMFHIRFY